MSRPEHGLNRDHLIAHHSVDVGEPITSYTDAVRWYKTIKQSEWFKDLKGQGFRFVMDHYRETFIVGFVASAAAITAYKMYHKHQRIKEKAVLEEIKEAKQKPGP